MASYDKLKLGDKGLHVYRVMLQNVARDDFGLTLAKMKGATCFLRGLELVKYWTEKITKIDTKER